MVNLVPIKIFKEFLNEIFSGNSFFKKIFWVYFFVFLIAPLGYLIRLLYSRTLDLAEFGLIYAILSFLSFISVFNNLGMSQSLIYYIPKYEARKDWDSIRNIVCYSFLFQLILNLIIIVVLFFISSYLAQTYFKYPSAEYILKIFLIVFLGTNMVSSITCLFNGLQKTTQVQFAQFLNHFLILSLSLIIVFFSLSDNLLESFSYIWAFVVIILVFYYFIYFRLAFPVLFEKLPAWNYSQFRSIFSYGFYSFIGQSMQILLLQIDIILITYFLTLESVGLYSNALSILSISTILLSPIIIFFIPMISKYKELKKN